MKNIIYPAIFHTDEDGKYFVTFPDLEGCLTGGDTLDEAYNMAGDALFAWFDTEDGAAEQPSPTPLKDITAEEGAIVMLVKAIPYESDEARQYKISEAIEDGLQKKNYSKSQVAQILGVSRSYITHIETGRKKPSPEMAKRIGILLGFDWHVFYESDNAAI